MEPKIQMENKEKKTLTTDKTGQVDNYFSLYLNLFVAFING